MHDSKSFCEVKRDLLGDEHPPYGGDSFLVVKKRLISEDEPLEPHESPDADPKLEAGSVADDLLAIAGELAGISDTHSEQADRIRALARRLQTEQ